MRIGYDVVVAGDVAGGKDAGNARRRCGLGKIEPAQPAAGDRAQHQRGMQRARRLGNVVDIKRLAGEAEGKMRISRVGPNARIPIKMGAIITMQGAQLLPEQILKFDFVQFSRPLEDRHEGRVFTGGPHPALSRGERNSAFQRVRITTRLFL